ASRSRWRGDLDAGLPPSSVGPRPPRGGRDRPWHVGGARRTGRARRRRGGRQLLDQRLPRSRRRVHRHARVRADRLSGTLVDEVRIDRWLWAARFFKTRGAATEAVGGGRVRLNGVRVKPAKDVRAGDTVE